MPLHSIILRDLKLLNAAFLPVLDYNISYKPELGLCLQRMIEAYNLLLLDQFSGYYKIESHQEQEISSRMSVL